MRPCNTEIVQTIVRTSELDVLCYRPTSLTGLSAVFTSLARCKGFVLCVSAFVKPTTKTTVEHCEIKFVKQIVWQIKLNPSKLRVICFGCRFCFFIQLFKFFLKFKFNMSNIFIYTGKRQLLRIGNVCNAYTF